jgi:hypothetical protein
MKKIRLIAIAMLLFPVLLNAQTWDERPGADFTMAYEDDFTDGLWDQATFDAQWTQVGAFTDANIANGYLEFIWLPQRIIYANATYNFPYSVEGQIAYGNASNRGGMVLRASALNENLQEPAAGDPGYNKEGLAIYALDSDSMIVQFTAADDATQAQIHVVKPAGAVDLFASPFVLKVEDYGSSLYAFIDDAPFARIDLSDLNAGVYSSGTVYEADMKVAGTFAGMEVVEIGHVAFTQRDAWLQLHTVNISNGTYTDTYDVSLNVTSDGTALEGASVKIGVETLNTNASGDVVFALINGTYDYGVYNFGYVAATGTVIVNNAAESEAVALTAEAAKPVYTFDSAYQIDFADVDAWADAESDFDAVWDQIDDFTAADVVANSHMFFTWVPHRVLTSKATYKTPYMFEAELSYPSATARGGIVIRHDPAIANENMQEPGNTVDILPMFNREGIAIFPTISGLGMNVQFSGPITGEGGYGTFIKRIEVPAPDGVNFRDQGILGVEDFGTYIYVYYDDSPIVRIELDGLVGNNYTTGTVYNGNMVPVEDFSGIEVIDEGKIGIAMRDDVGGTVAMNVFYINIEKVLVAPDAPADAVASAGDTEATVTFTVPASDGGSVITGYTVTSSPEGLTATGTESPITVTGLTNGTEYTFTITATNTIGISDASAASNAVTPAPPATVSDAPGSVVATLGDSYDEVSIAFTVPASDGGSAIFNYTVTSTPDGITATGTESPILVTGLSVNTSYTFTVSATNAVGDSPESAVSNEVTTPATTSIEDNMLSEVSIYQNNAGIMVDMKSLKGHQNIYIYNILGREVLSYQANGGIEFQIESQIEPGIYFIKIQGEGKSHSRKIMVK